MNNWFNHLYPHGNLHELNLDWIINTIKKLTESMDNFINLNTIKYANPILWDITRQYEANTVVIDGRTGNAYISTKAVPSGVQITRTEFWTQIFNYANIIDTLRSQIATNVGDVTTSPQAFNVGQLVWIGGQLYSVISAISPGDSFMLNSNIEHTTIENLLGNLNQLNTENKESLVSAINEAMHYISVNYQIFTDTINRIDGNLESVDDTLSEHESLISDNNTLIVNALNALADNGIVLNDYLTLYVDTIAHDNYITLREAITQARTSNIPTIIMIKNGMYDMSALFPVDTDTSGCVVPNRTFLVGESKSNCILSASLIESNLNYSTLNLTRTSGLFNMTIKGTKCRYCVHDDNSTDGKYTRIIKNVKFDGSNLSLRWAYGAGIRPGETLKLIDCEFYNNNGCFSIHNWVGEKLDSHITLENCMFTQYSLGDNPYDVVLTSMYEYDGNTNHGDVIVNVNGCNAGSIAFTSDPDTTNYFYLNCDNPDTPLMFFYYPERINKPNYKRIANTSGITGKGELVAFTDSNTRGRLFETNYSKAFANAITISDELPDGTFIVVTGGNIQPGDIGFVMTPGQFLTYDRVNTELVVTTQDPTDMWLGYMRASNTLKLTLN